MTKNRLMAVADFVFEELPLLWLKMARGRGVGVRILALFVTVPWWLIVALPLVLIATAPCLVALVVSDMWDATGDDW